MNGKSEIVLKYFCKLFTYANVLPSAVCVWRLAFECICVCKNWYLVFLSVNTPKVYHNLQF